MPEGSSSAAPVITPGPSTWRKRRRGDSGGSPRASGLDGSAGSSTDWLTNSPPSVRSCTRRSVAERIFLHQTTSQSHFIDVGLSASCTYEHEGVSYTLLLLHPGVGANARYGSNEWRKSAAGRADQPSGDPPAR